MSHPTLVCDDASSVKLHIEGFYGRSGDTLSSKYSAPHFVSEAVTVAMFTYELRDEGNMALCHFCSL